MERSVNKRRNSWYIKPLAASTARETIENEAEAFLRGGPFSFYSGFVECNFAPLPYLAAKDGVRRRSVGRTQCTRGRNSVFYCPLRS